MNKKLEHYASQRGLDLVTFIFVRPDFVSLHSLIEQILNSSPYPGALQKFRAICTVRAAFHKTISEFSSRTLSK